MKATLPLPAFPTIMLETTTLTSAPWESDDACGLVLLLPEGNRDAVEKTPWADALRLRMDAFPEKTNPVLTNTPNGLRTAIGFIGEGVASFKLLTLARKLVGPLLTERPRQIKVVSLLDDSIAARAMAQALVAAVHAAVFRLPKITGKPEDLSTLQTVSFVGDYAGAEFNHALAGAGRKPHWPERGEVQRCHHCTEWHYH